METFSDAQTLALSPLYSHSLGILIEWKHPAGFSGNTCILEFPLAGDIN
jgi:hypothetical protein